MTPGSGRGLEPSAYWHWRLARLGGTNCNLKYAHLSKISQVISNLYLCLIVLLIFLPFSHYFSVPVNFVTTSQVTLLPFTLYAVTSAARRKWPPSASGNILFEVNYHRYGRLEYLREECNVYVWDLCYDQLMELFTSVQDWNISHTLTPASWQRDVKTKVAVQDFYWGLDRVAVFTLKRVDWDIFIFHPILTLVEVESYQSEAFIRTCVLG